LDYIISRFLKQIENFLAKDQQKERMVKKYRLYYSAFTKCHFERLQEEADF
jgi:hypothetical protein